MLEIEIIGVFVAIFIGLAFFNLYLLLHFLNRKGTIVRRVKALKKSWLESLPEKFSDLGNEINEGNINEDGITNRVLDIISSYYLLDNIELQYSGREKRSIITDLLWNYFGLVFGALFIIFAIFFNDINGQIIFSIFGGLFLAMFLGYLYKALSHLKNEEDNLLEIENELQ